MKIALGADHAGYKLKGEILRHLQSKGLEAEDFGCFQENSCDYPDFAEKAGEAVASGRCTLGILVCGTGAGIAIAANKIRGVRAAVVHDAFTAEFTRKHNDANILALGSRVIGPGLALLLTDIFLQTDFEGGRHEDRVLKIKALEDRRSESVHAANVTNSKGGYL